MSTSPSSGRPLGLTVTVAVYLLALVAAAATARALEGAHPLLVVLLADLVGTAVVFAASVAANNSSLYDPYWSVAPPVIALYYVFGPTAGQADPVRAFVLVALVLAWGTRLTWNWARGWSGLGHEDWRYVDIRRKSGAFYWPASLLSIHLMPTMFVYLGSLSLWVGLARSGRPFGVLDGLGLLVAGLAVLVEATADRQLAEFRASAPAPGAVLGTGLWRYCRHPNYSGEVLFWWGLYLFALGADPARAWVALGPLLITGLFVFISVPLIDRRMLERRPAYAARLTLPALVPGGARQRGDSGT